MNKYEQWLQDNQHPIQQALEQACLNWVNQQAIAHEHDAIDSLEETQEGKFVTVLKNGKKSHYKVGYHFSKKDLFLYVVTLNHYVNGKQTFTTGETLSGLWNKGNPNLTNIKVTSKPLVKPINENKIKREQQAKQNAFEKDLKVWESLPLVGESKYLNNKQISNLPEGLVKYGKDFILVALKDWHKNIIGFQKIFHDGKKSYTYGLSKNENAAFISIRGNLEKFVICEGFATGASIYLATGFTVLCAGDASNLGNVAKSLHDYLNGKTATVFIAADNDLRKETDKCQINTGLVAAEKVAQQFNFKLIVPQLNGQKCDFNDLHINQGLDVVTKAFQETKKKKTNVVSIKVKEEETVEFIEQNQKTLAAWQISYNALVEEMNKTYAQVLVGGKHRIMKLVKAKNSVNSRDSYEFLEQSQYEKIHQNTKWKVGEYFDDKGKLKSIFFNKIKAWATHPECRIYSGGVVFRPYVSQCPDIDDNYFNTWQGYAVQPKEGDWTLVKAHIEEIICQNNETLINYFFNWCAYIFQNPARPAGSAIILRGKKGTGKGSIASFIMSLWGNHSLHITSPDHLVGNFNGHFEDVCFVFADEAFFSGDRAHEGVLKGLITEKQLIIERKGIDGVQQPNYLKIFMSTNSDYAVPASKDERRYFVLDVSDERRGDREYFNSLSEDTHDRDVQAAFLYDMLHRDISGFHTGDIPETDALKEQRYHSLDSVGKWIVDCLERGYFNTNGGWEHEVPTAVMFGSYQDWCKSMKVDKFEINSLIVFSKRLKTIFKKTLVGVSRERGWSLGTLEEAIVQVEEIEKIKIAKE
jgi:phage/plasmid primase-like uncharacterized protein